MKSGYRERLSEDKRVTYIQDQKGWFFTLTTGGQTYGTGRRFRTFIEARNLAHRIHGRKKDGGPNRRSG